METLDSAICLIQSDCFFASLDLKDAYFSVPIAQEHRKFLRFQWRGVLYEFCVLPFGLSSAPRVFTKILKPMIAYLRNLGFVSCNYIDDALLIGSNYDECLINVQTRTELCESLGFVLNRKKSVLVPCQQIEFLGFIIDSTSMTISLPKKKEDLIFSSCHNLCLKSECKIRELARVIGILLAAERAVPYGALFRRDLEMVKNSALELRKGNFDAFVSLGSDTKNALSWWASNVRNACSPIHRKIDVELQTDASLEGWGVFSPTTNSSTQGHWNSHERKHHINALELLAVLFALQALCSSLVNVHVLVKSDNSTAVSCLNRFGTCHSSFLNSISRRIWLWCMKRKIWISAEYIQGKQNIIADSFSRKFKENTEWMLDSGTFLHLCKVFFTPDVDLFASRLNKRVNTFVSWQPDPDALATNAFSLNWSEFCSYIFPPFCLISRIIQKLLHDQGEAIVIVPLWQTQPWYPRLLEMLIDFPVLLLNANSLLSLPFSDRSHPLHHLKLLACHLSGVTCKAEVFRRNLQKSFFIPGKSLPQNHTTQLCENGFFSVVKGKKIPFVVL